MSDSEELPPPTWQEIAARFFDAVTVFFKLRKHMPVSLLATFLTVAKKQGLTVAELAASRGISGAVMSRQLGELGSRTRQGEPGLGLLAMVQRSYGDRRERRVILTERGVVVALQLHAAVRGEGPMAKQMRRRT